MAETTREAQLLLDLYREQEQILADLYEGFSAQFPSEAPRWKEFAGAKRQNADLVDNLKAKLAEGQFRYTPGGLHHNALRTSVQGLRSDIEERWKAPRSLDHALEIAMKIEKNIIEKSLFSTFQSDAPELAALFKRLSKGTGEHYRQIRQLILRRTKYTGLIERGLISLPSLEQAIADARRDNLPVSRVLTSKLGVPKGELVKHLRDYFGVPSYQPGIDPPPPASLIKLYSGMRKVFQRDQFVPVGEHDGVLTVAVEDPKNLLHNSAVGAAFDKRRVAYCVATPDDINATIDLFFTPRAAQRASLALVLDELGTAPKVTQAAVMTPERVVSEEDTAVVRLVNHIVEDAVIRRASDIHIEPSQTEAVQVRLRIDGELYKTVTIPRQLQRVVVTRLKIMAGLDIAERRRPQSGKITFRNWGSLDVELRLETYPTVAAEDAVLRILAEARVPPLETLKLLPDNEATLRRILDRPYGLLLCVGPTGSGKTTTLHSALAELNRGDYKILTVEDPVEISQEGLRQVQVNAKAGLTFPVALRSFLRADPDIIMVGEMRDLETASIAVASSLTGHLVLSTLHTNNAPETVTRLIDIGLDRFSFSDSLLGVLAQRLVRSLCEQCAATAPIGAEVLAALREDYGDSPGFDRLAVAPTHDWKSPGQGCEGCSGRRFKGRLAVHELMELNDSLRQLICQEASARDLRSVAITNGMRTLRQDGIRKALAGWTTLEEVRAVTSR